MSRRFRTAPPRPTRVFASRVFAGFIIRLRSLPKICVRSHSLLLLLQYLQFFHTECNPPAVRPQKPGLHLSLHGTPPDTGPDMSQHVLYTPHEPHPPGFASCRTAERPNNLHPAGRHIELCRAPIGPGQCVTTGLTGHHLWRDKASLGLVSTLDEYQRYHPSGAAAGTQNRSQPPWTTLVSQERAQYDGR